jgi:hypothetical protein
MQRFEGQTLEAALHEVIMTVGSEARIVKADTVRSGGIGGFFSREFVEVWVEVDEAAALQVTQFWGKSVSGSSKKKTARPKPTKSIGIGFDAREIKSAPSNAVTESPKQSSVPVADTTSAPTKVKEAVQAAQATTSALMDLVEQINQEDRRVLALAVGAENLDPSSTAALLSSNTQEAQRVTTEGESFASVLNRIAQQTGHDPMPLARFVPNDELDSNVALVAEVISDGSDATSNSIGFLQSESTAIDAMVDEAITMPTAATPTTMSTEIDLRRSSTTEPSTSTSSELRMLGVPEQYLPRPTALGDVYNRLLSAFRELPKPASLPTGEGSVIAIAGWRKGAIATAHDLSIQLGLDPADIVIASAHGNNLASARERTITSAQQADEQRRSWRWRDRPTIVVVDAALGTKDVDWATAVMKGLAPNTVWGVVDATRKSDDIADWGARLGGMDAFALVGTSITRTPATVLELGVPVALMDGEPATADRWATLLTNKLSAA